MKPSKKTKQEDLKNPPAPRRQAVDLDRIQQGIEKYSRVPFTDILRQALANTPSDQAISDMSEADPLRWADYTTKIAKLYGYSESQSMTVTHRVIHEMTTQEIEVELSELERRSNSAKDITPK